MPRRAAVSGFGFGGINAHLLFEEWLPGNEVSGTKARIPDIHPREQAAPAAPIAVVAVDAHFGPWTTLQAFRERVLGGGPDIEAGTPRPLVGRGGE